MKVPIAIAGAGNVGRSIASELLTNGHAVMLIERERHAVKPHILPEATWVHADACEYSSLQDARLQDYGVMIAATGDDKVNLVVSLLAKTEFGVNRVVARINHPKNEWMFTLQWGVDVAVSTPRMLAALVEEAVSVGDLVKLMSFRQSDSNLVEITLAADGAHIGRAVRDLQLPRNAALVAILRGARVIVPTPDDPLEAGDELLFVATDDVERAIHDAVSGIATIAPA